MPIKLLPFFLFVCYFYSNAQEITITNSINKNPIDNVLILNKSGIYLGKTDLDGKFEKKYLKNLKAFVILHPTIKTDTITLTEIVNDAIEVKQISEQPTIKIDKNNSNKQYFIIKGFFNSYDTENGMLTRYTDGIVQYIFDNNKNTFENYKMEEYRNFIYNDRNSADYDPTFDYTGIRQSPSIYNLEDLKKFKKHVNKNFNALQNKLIIEKSNDSIQEENSSKLLGYTFKNRKYQIVYKFSGDDIDYFELLNIFQAYKEEAKHKKQNKLSTFSSISNFYPLEIKYLDKNEIEKGVKFKTQKSNFTTKYWQQNNFSYLIDYLSQKSLYDIRLKKNQQ